MKLQNHQVNLFTIDYFDFSFTNRKLETILGFVSHDPPTTFSAPYTYVLGQPAKMQSIVRVILVSHVAKLHPGTRSVHVSVFVSFWTKP